MYRIFTYGTLMRGMERSFVLANSEFIGEARTLPKFTLISYYDSFPGLLRNGVTAIRGELYTIDDEILAALDVIEGCIPASPKLSFYTREEIEMDTGEIALSYFFNKYDQKAASDCPIIKSGDWRAYLKER